MRDPFLTKSLVRTIEAIARNYQASRVVAVCIWIGATAGITPEQLRRTFSREAVGTCAEGAQLSVELSDDPDNPDAGEVMIFSVEFGDVSPAAG